MVYLDLSAVELLVNALYACICNECVTCILVLCCFNNTTEKFKVFVALCCDTDNELDNIVIPLNAVGIGHNDHAGLLDEGLDFVGAVRNCNMVADSDGEAYMMPLPP